jgi:hypothetical protein
LAFPMTATGHDLPIEAAHGGSALRPISVVARPNVRYEPYFGRDEARL